MQVQQLESDIYLFVGETYHSNSVAFVSGDDCLLVDALASREDAEELRVRVETELKKRVRFILVTHYFSDHLAALKLFPDAHIIAHQNYLHTFTSEKFRSEEEAAHFVEPTILVSDSLTMRWGRCTLDIFHNPGHTMSTLNVEVPEADLLLVGDTVVGNIAYLAYSPPELIERALRRLQGRRRGRLISSHTRARGSEAIDRALFYLDSLREQVAGARLSPDNGHSVLDIPLEKCLSPEARGSEFERMFHRRNLDAIVERKLFAHTGHGV